MYTENFNRTVAETLALGAIITALSYALMLVFGIIDFTSINIIEAAAVSLTYTSVALAVLQRRATYTVGTIAVLLYAMTFYQVGLMASAALNIYLIFQQIYGWFRWRADEQPLVVTRLKADHWLLGYAAITGLTWLGASAIFQYFGTTMSYLDVAIVIMSILAQFLMDNKKIETWLIWAVVNCLAIYVYGSQGLYAVVIQYIILLINVAFGFHMWRKSWKSEL